MPELFMILLILALLALAGGAVFGLVWYFSTRSKPPPFPRPATVQDRLAEIDALRAGNHITEVEYQAKRKDILDRL